MNSSAMDPLLQPYIRAADKTAMVELDRLVREHINPMIQNVLRGHISETDSREDKEDLHSIACTKVTWALRQRRETGWKQPIANLKAYVATITHNVFNDFLREKYPLRKLISTQVRSILRSQPGLALWEDKDGQEWCGFAVWHRPGGPLASPHNRARLRTKSLEIVARRLPAEDPATANLIDLCESLLNEMQGSVRFTDLVDAIAALRKDAVTLTQTEREQNKDESEPKDTPATSKDAIEIQLEHRYSLAFVWKEILELPPDQRAALLLKMDNIQELPATGIAGIGQIADAIGIPRPEFYALWNTLPLEDVRIARQLGLDIQQVINRRSKARLRLQRRLLDFGS